MPPIIEELQSFAVVTISSETVSFVKQDGTADAGEAAGTTVYGLLANNKVLNLLGNQMGEKSGTGVASSIVFTTGVMDSTKEIQWQVQDININAQISNMLTVVNAAANGTWTCHYPSGLIIVKKAGVGTTQAITSYKVRKSDVSLQVGDIEIGAVELKNGTDDTRGKISTAGADGVSNTQNELEVSSRNSGFNGSTWDRLRAGITAVTSTLTGWLNTLPWAVYNATPTTRTEGQGGPHQADANGNLQINQNTLLSGENQAANRLMSSRPGTPNRITTATTTTLITGTGSLIGVLVEVALTGTVTIYDNTAASGTIIAILPIGTVAGYYFFNAKFVTGCTFVTSAADRVVGVTEPN